MLRRDGQEVEVPHAVRMRFRAEVRSDDDHARVVLQDDPLMIVVEGLQHGCFIGVRGPCLFREGSHRRCVRLRCETDRVCTYQRGILSALEDEPEVRP